MNEVISSFLNKKISENKFLLATVALRDFKDGVNLLKNDFYSESFEGYSDCYNTSKLFKEDLLSEPLFCKTSSRYVGSSDDAWDLIENNCLAAINIDVSVLDQGMADYCFEKEPCLIYFLNSKFQTTDNTLAIIKKEPLLLEYIQDELKTYKLCNLAFSLDKRVIKYMPTELVNENTVLELKNSEQYILEYIPSRYWDDELLTAQIQIDVKRAINHIVKEYFLSGKVEKLTQVIEIVIQNKSALNLMSLDPIIMKHPQFTDFIEQYAQINSEIYSILNIETAPRDMHDLMIKSGFLDSVDESLIPDVLWRESYKAIYESKSILAYKYPQKYFSILKSHKGYWLKNWIELKKSNHPNLPEIPAHMVTKEALEDSDIYSEIYEHRLATNLMMKGDVTIDALREINHLNTSIAELDRIKENIPSETLLELQKIDAYWLTIKIEDGSLANSEAVRLVSEYPYLVSALPRTILKNQEIIEEIKQKSPRAYSYLIKEA